ncbi:hypothetical protein AeMF1_003664 [Aphanomyces euteiches]|nr:hypothetical protein AeMF1_003664 [Aphanomyces euteiches]
MPTFPLPDDFFRCAPLSSQEKRAFKALSRRITDDVIERSRISESVAHWKPASNEHDVQVYEGTDPTAPVGVLSWAGVTGITATIEEAETLFVAFSTTEFKNNNQIVSKNDLLDCAHLYTVARSEKESITLRWFALQTPIPGMIRPRDVCYLDAMRHFETEDGKRGFVVAMSSVPLGCCPEFRRTLGLVRSHLYRGGFVVQETDRPDYLLVTQVYQMDPSGSIPTWIVAQAVKTRVKNMRHLDRHLREKRLSTLNYLPESALIPKSARSKCFLCQRKFHSLVGVSKKQCRLCGEVFCGGCSKTWSITANGFLTHMAICTSCSLGHRNHYAHSSLGSQSRTLQRSASSIGVRRQVSSQLHPPLSPDDAEKPLSPILLRDEDDIPAKDVHDMVPLMAAISLQASGQPSSDQLYRRLDGTSIPTSRTGASL